MAFYRIKRSVLWNTAPAVSRESVKAVNFTQTSALPAPGGMTGLLFLTFNHCVAGTSLHTFYALSNLILSPDKYIS